MPLSPRVVHERPQEKTFDITFSSPEFTASPYSASPQSYRYRNVRARRLASALTRAVNKLFLEREVRGTRWKRVVIEVNYLGTDFE